jgi:hypothetical protein
VGTFLVTVALVGSGAAMVWLAWLGSQGRLRPDPTRRAVHQAAAGPIGVTGGVLVLAGVAVAVSGLDSRPGQVALAVGMLALVVGSLVTAVVARRARGDDAGGA